MPMLDRRRLLLSSSAGLAAAAVPGLVLPRRAAAADFTVGFIYVGPQGRLRLQPGARRGRGRAQEDAGRQGRRGGEGPRDRRRPEDHGEHDQPGRRHADLPDLVRLLRSAHARRWPRSIPTSSSATAAACGTRASTRRTPAATSATSTRRQYLNGIVAGLTSKTKKLGFVAAKPIPQVLRNINAFTLGARIGRPDDHHAGDLHRRLVAAGQGGGGRQQPDRPGRRRPHLPRRQPEGGRRDRRAARHLRLRLPRQPGGAGAEGLPHRRRVELGHGLHRCTSSRRQAASRCPNFVRGGLKEGFVKTSALRRRRSATPPRRRPTRPRPR